MKNINQSNVPLPDDEKLLIAPAPAINLNEPDLAGEVHGSAAPCAQCNAPAGNEKTLELPATRENLPLAQAFTEKFLEALDCPPKTLMQIGLSVEELFVNIASYAYPDGGGTVRMTLKEENGLFTLTFSDSGVPFDPLAMDDPDLTLSADDRPVGGLGVFIVKNTMDETAYRYADGKNVLTIKKKLF